MPGDAQEPEHARGKGPHGQRRPVRERPVQVLRGKRRHKGGAVRVEGAGRTRQGRGAPQPLPARPGTRLVGVVSRESVRPAQGVTPTKEGLHQELHAACVGCKAPFLQET